MAGGRGGAWAAATVLAATVLAGCGSEQAAQPTDTEGTTTTGAPLIVSEGLVVEPNTGLRDGDAVTVTDEEIPMEVVVPSITQCQTPTAEYPGGRCDEGRAPLDVIGDGSVVMPPTEFVVHDTITVAGKPFDCTAAPDACVVRLSIGAGEISQPTVGLTFAD